MGALQCRVLLVDDEPAVLVTLARRLESRFALEVICAESHRSAVAVLQTLRFDGAVVDLALGDGTGLDVLEALCLRRPEASLALMTGHRPPDEQLNRVAALGALVLHKPFEPAHLSSWVASARAAMEARAGCLAPLEGAARLSARERESLELRLSGLQSHEAAARVGVAVSTERKLVQRGLLKMGVSSVVELRHRVETARGDR